MNKNIKQPINCLINFTNKKPIPISFTLNNKTYVIEKTNFIYNDKTNNGLTWYFFVTTNKGTYNLALNTSNLEVNIEENYEVLEENNAFSVNEDAITYTLKHF